MVEQAVDGIEALAAIDRLDPPPIPAVMVLEHRMPGLSGLDVAKQVLHTHPTQHIVLFSAWLEPQLVDEAEKLGVSCLSKSRADELAKVVASLAAA